MTALRTFDSTTAGNLYEMIGRAPDPESLDSLASKTWGGSAEAKYPRTMQHSSINASGTGAP